MCDYSLFEIQHTDISTFRQNQCDIFRCTYEIGKVFLLSNDVRCLCFSGCKLEITCSVYCSGKVLESFKKLVDLIEKKRKKQVIGIIGKLKDLWVQVCFGYFQLIEKVLLSCRCEALKDEIAHPLLRN